MLGKGPSFQKLRETDHREFHTCSLNHVVRELPVTLAHMIDIDVVSDCADVLERNAQFLVLPYRPHVRNSPGERTIEDFVSEMPVLKRLASAGRLLWYNLSTSAPHQDLPVIKAKFFSAEAALNLLVACGARTIRSLGVDGGSSYSTAFDDLKGKTLLANGHATFDKQFAGICQTIRGTGIVYAPLHYEAPIRVFVGTDAVQMLGVRMLEYSIKKFTPMSVDVVPLDDRDVPVPLKPENRSRTGFSFCRFRIPELCGYKGRAIYMDADMQVFTDLTALWNWPMKGADVLYCRQPPERGRAPQYSVMLMDCADLDWNIGRIIEGLDKGLYDYDDLMRNCCILADDLKTMELPAEWNSLELYEPGSTCLIHYTDMPTQPWVSNRNPHGSLWYALVKEAVAEGFLPLEEIHLEIERGHVSPELTRWVGLPDVRNAEKLLQEWVPPYQRFTRRNAVRTAEPVAFAAPNARRGWLMGLRRLLSAR